MKEFTVRMFVAFAVSGALACSAPHYVVPSECQLWTGAELVVRGQVSSLGAEGVSTFSGESSVTVPVTIAVQRTIKGAPAQTVSAVLVKGRVGSVANDWGDMSNASGVFWLRRVDGQLLLSFLFFSPASGSGFLRVQNQPDRGVFTEAEIDQLATTCATDAGTPDGGQ